MVLKKIIFCFVLIANSLVYSQSFNVQELGKSKLINVSGGVSANSVFYSGTAARDPFTYFLNGNVNFNIANLYNLPFSFSYTNQQFGYNKPVLMNRLSIHPSYKWITLHIGDVNMTFSPYTLSGHQFTGLGVDLTPNSKFKFSAMYGRLLKNTEYDLNDPTIIPVYKRMGYGFKSGYAFDNLKLGFTFFKAKDVISSLENPFPFQLGVTPKENVALGFDTSFSIFKSLQINAEYSTSSITEDASGNDGKKTGSILGIIMRQNATTKSYNALKTQFNYQIKNGTLGLGYERVAPNYRSLGGYYFNNDLENITINANQNLFKNKLNLALSVGLQRDDLNNQKKSTSKRTVSSLNITFKASENLNIDGNYSNFQSFTNSKNQFDYINQVSQYDNLDTLNYRQVSQNAGLNIAYLIKNSKEIRKSINLGLSMQDVVNKQDNLTVAGGASSFYNSALSYTVNYPEKGLSILSAFNATYNTADTGDSKIFGPTLGVNKLFFKKKMTSAFSSSYNLSYTENIKQNSLINLRLNCSYIAFEKHNFSLALLSLFGQSVARNNKDLTATLSYTYSFDKIKLRPVVKKTTPDPTTTTVDATKVSEEIIKISMGKTKLEGTKSSIIAQLKAMPTSLSPVIKKDSIVFIGLINALETTQNDKAFKEKTIDFMEAFQTKENQIKLYKEYLVTILIDLNQQMNQGDERIEQIFVDQTEKVNNHPLYGRENINKEDPDYNNYMDLVAKSDKARTMLLQHRWILSQLNSILQDKNTDFNKNNYLNQFMNQEASTVLGAIENKEEGEKTKQNLAKKIIPFYYNWAKTASVNDTITLKYTR
jgi:hypothetical protein